MFSSSSDVNFNPAVPLSAGFLMGFVSSIYSSGLLKRSNNEGVLFTYAHYQRFVTPAIGGAILVAILHGVAEYKNGSYDDYRPADRDATGHGAFQLVGIPLSIAFGAAAGAIVGLLYRIVNNYEHEDHFKDETVYKPLDDGQIDS